MTYDVFISYAKEDEARAKAYATRLQQAGLKIFFAPQILRDTQHNLQARLLHEIDQARYLLLIWSRWLENSQWVAFEMSIYATKRLTQGSGATRLIALDFGGSRLPGWLPCDLVLNPNSDSCLEELFRSDDWVFRGNCDIGDRRSLAEIIRRFASLIGALLFEVRLWVLVWRSTIPRLNANFSLSQVRSDELKKPQVRKLIFQLTLGTVAICFLTTSVALVLSGWVFSPSYVPDWRGYINKEVLLIGLFVIASGLVAALRIGFGAALVGSLLAVSFGSSTTLVLGWIKNVERPDPIASGVTVGITLGTYAAMGCILGRSRVGPTPRRAWSWGLVAVAFTTVMIVGGVQLLATRWGGLYHLSSTAGRAGLGLAFGAMAFLPLAAVVAVVAYVQRRGYLWRRAAWVGCLLWVGLSGVTAIFAAFVPENPFELLNAVGVGLLAGAATAGMATFVGALTEPAFGETWGMSVAVIILLVIGLPFLRLAPNIRPTLVYESIIVSTPLAYLFVLSTHRKTSAQPSAEIVSDVTNYKGPTTNGHHGMQKRVEPPENQR